MEAYLSTIADAYGVQWPRKAKEELVEDDEDENEDGGDAPSGGQKVKAVEVPLSNEDLSRATPPRNMGPKSPVSVMPPSPSTDNIAPRLKLPDKAQKGTEKKNEVNGVAASKKDAGPGGKIPDVNELAKRFAQLKR